jgi:hypothetical protein
MGKTATIEKNIGEQEQEAQEITCQHHWVIDTPRGAMSQGRCKRCGEEREFRNSATDHLWEDESGSGYNAWRGVKSAPVRASSDDDVTAAGASIAAVMV